MSKISDQLRRDEGMRLSAYQDHLGFWTIGIGRLIDSRKGGGITDAEAEYLLQNDIKKVQDQVFKSLPWAASLTEARQGVLLNMAFQLGIAGLLKFKNTLAYVEKGMFMAAANEMLKSAWAEQTPARAARLSRQMMTGEWQ